MCRSQGSFGCQSQGLDPGCLSGSETVCNSLDRLQLCEEI